MTASRRLRVVLACAVTLLLPACGGGDMLASGGIVGTGDATLFATGVVSATGPGTVTVNGIVVDAGQAAVTVDGQQAASAALKVGMVVSVEASVQGAGTVVASRLDYRAQLRGTVDGVDGASRTFTVLGQPVVTDAATVFDGGNFDTLRNQWVEVSGLRGAPGTLLATRVEIRPAPGALATQVAGTVSALDVVARTFRVGGVLVDYAQAALPANVRDGSAVLVVGTFSAALDRVAATSIAAVPAPPVVESARIEIEGLVAGFASLSRFVVDGRHVDASSALVEGGPPGAIVDGARVEVEGRLRMGVVVASRVVIAAVPTLAIEGLVEGVDATARSLVLAGQTITTTPQTRYVDASTTPVASFGFASVTIGDLLTVRAQRHAAELVATHVERRDRAAPPPGTTTRVEGRVSSFVSVADFLVGAQRVNAASARIENGLASGLRDGARVEAEGIMSGSVLLATRVAFVADPTVPAVAVEIEGVVSGFASLARFRVAAQPVDATSARFVHGVAADLADGRRVTVRGVLATGVVQATSVEFHTAPPPAGATVELEGAISDFVSVADFRVDGQRVDATAARFSGGSVVSLANGRRVHVKGTLAGGVVRAQTVAIEDDTAGVEAHVEGRITVFVSVANFTVAGRVVDASAARFEKGTSTDLRVGREVHVEGRIVAGVLRATKVALE